MKQKTSGGAQESVFDGTKHVFSALPYLIIIVVFFAVVLVGLSLTPSSCGIGTHEELGLPPCGFLIITGYPCPSCGLTTAFTLILHGRVTDAFLVQPFGVMLFLVFFIAAGLSVAALLLRLPFSAVLDSRHLDRIQMILLVSMILAWIYKIYIMR